MKVVISLDINFLICPHRNGVGLIASAHFCNSHFLVTSLPLSNVRSLTVRLIYNILGSSDSKVELLIRQTVRKKKKDKRKDPRTGKFAKTWNFKEEKAIYIESKSRIILGTCTPVLHLIFTYLGFVKRAWW